MDVAVPDQRLAVCSSPSRRSPIEIECSGEHGVVLDGIEEMRMAIHHLSKRRGNGEERMWRDDQSILARFQLRKIIEAVDGFGGRAEIQQEDVPALDRSLDAANERDAAVGRVRRERTHVELTIVECDGQRVVSELRRTIDELMRRMRNVVDRIVRSVGMQFDFEHFNDLLKILAVIQDLDCLGYRHRAAAT